MTVVPIGNEAEASVAIPKTSAIVAMLAKKIFFRVTLWAVTPSSSFSDSSS